jgi:RNA polymerase-binding transcription factor DksA
MANKKTSSKKNSGVKRDVVIEMVKKRRSSLTRHDNRSSSYFSMDDVLDVLRTRSEEGLDAANNIKIQNKQKIVEQIRKDSKNIVISAAGVADILGFNPAVQKNKVDDRKIKDVPENLKVYYNNLLILREIVQHKLNNDEIPSKLLCKKNAFDPEFALTMLPPDQGALNEVDEALNRIETGTFGVCEITGETISDERLMIFPFTRYSVEGKKEHEQQIAMKEKERSSGAFAEDIDSGFGLYDGEIIDE